MTRFQHEPFKKIIIKNLVQENLDNFLYRCCAGRIPDMIWVDGILMYPKRYRFNSGTAEYEDMKNGIKYYEILYFVKFPKYQLTLKWKDGGEYEFRLIHNNNNRQLRELAKWIKSQPEWNEKPEGTSTEEVKI